jgi:uncharacterized protein YegJ (DUF2314 family)
LELYEPGFPLESKWRGQKITGLLQNTPFEVAGLHAGQKVEVHEEDVFDYLRRHPDGKTEGNETGPLLHAKGDKADSTGASRGGERER